MAVDMNQAFRRELSAKNTALNTERRHLLFARRGDIAVDVHTSDSQTTIFLNSD